MMMDADDRLSARYGPPDGQVLVVESAPKRSQVSLNAQHAPTGPSGAHVRFSSAYTWEQLDPLIAKQKDIAAAHGVTPSAVALNWVISHGAIPLGGARNAKQAEENAKALSFALTEDEVAQLTELSFEGKT